MYQMWSVRRRFCSEPRRKQDETESQPIHKRRRRKTRELLQFVVTDPASKRDTTDTQLIRIQDGNRDAQFGALEAKEKYLYLIKDNNIEPVIKLRGILSGWEELPQRPGVQCWGFSVVGCAGKLYVVGGQDIIADKTTNIVQQYDTQTGWQARPPMLENRRWFGAAVLSGRLFAIGGWGKFSLSSAEECNVENGNWAPVAHMTVARHGLGVAAFDNRLFAVGGWVGKSRLNSAEYYDLHEKKWTNVAPMHEYRYNCSCSVLGELLYVAGGLTDSITPTASVEWYDFRADKWTRAGAMNIPRQRFALAVLNGQLLAAGGDTSGGEELDTVEVYDVRRDAWSMLDVRLPHAGRFAGCVVEVY